MHRSKSFVRIFHFTRIFVLQRVSLVIFVGFLSNTYLALLFCVFFDGRENKTHFSRWESHRSQSWYECCGDCNNDEKYIPVVKWKKFFFFSSFCWTRKTVRNLHCSHQWLQFTDFENKCVKLCGTKERLWQNYKGNLII